MGIWFVIRQIIKIAKLHICNQFWQQVVYPVMWLQSSVHNMLNQFNIRHSLGGGGTVKLKANKSSIRCLNYSDFESYHCLDLPRPQSHHPPRPPLPHTRPKRHCYRSHPSHGLLWSFVQNLWVYSGPPAYLYRRILSYQLPVGPGPGGLGCAPLKVRWGIEWSRLCLRMVLSDIPSVLCWRTPAPAQCQGTPTRVAGYLWCIQLTWLLAKE